MRPRARTSPIASSVPSSVATTIVIAAILRLAYSGFVTVSSFKNVRYQRRESPSKLESELDELNENTITTMIGTNR